jgi:ABC-type transport system substrate-binding protein
MNLIVISIIIFSLMTSVTNNEVDSVHYNFTIVAKTNGGGTRPDILNILKQQLVPLGINLEVIVQDWPTFVGELIAHRDFDLCYVSLTGGGADPDFTGVYDENGSLNLFGYHTSMDWDEELGTGKNQWYIEEGTQIMPPNSEERIQHYWEWQDYFMDKICPLIPTFSPKVYSAQWTTLVGYDLADGILQSWGKMGWSATHPGQVSTNEVVIADAAWSDLNPFFQDDSSSSFISSACMDPLIWFDEDLSAWPHVAESFDMINDTLIRIVVRDGIKWAPDPDGLFTDEYVDARDVYFSTYIWTQISSDIHEWAWMDEIRIIDDMTLDFYIDGDRSTLEKEPYAPFLYSLSTKILPEFYLNQTQLSDGKTPDITHPSWSTFARNCFGTGLFEISDFDEGNETILTMRPDCWRLDPSLASDSDLDWERRFGDFSTSPDQLRVRIITNDNEEYTEFENGRLDTIGITSNQWKRYEYQENPAFIVQENTYYSFGFIGFNMRESREIIGSRAVCPNDPTMTIGLAVRKAISYATDRVEINNIVYNGEMIISNTPLYPKMGIWNNPNIISYDFDMYKAKELMIKAGFIIENFTPTVFIHGFTGVLSISSILFASVIFFISKKNKRIN